jgi:hypothetical protein
VNSTNESVLQTSYTNVSTYRVKSGAKFETEMVHRLLSNGIVTTKLSVNVGRGLKKVADHYFEGTKNKYWIETTTCLSKQARVDELILKKFSVQQVEPSINKWVIFFRKESVMTKDSDATMNAFRKNLKDAGYTLCVGDDEINNYIDEIKITESISPRPIHVAKAMNLPLSSIFDNERNRENIPQSVSSLKSGILDVGFITQFNVVPEAVNGKLTGRYMLIEGDNRRTAFLELLQLGHEFESGNDPLVPCSVIHWLTTEDKREVAKLMVDTNTKSNPWAMTNYIDYHHKVSAEDYVPEPEKHSAYEFLQWLRTLQTRKTSILKSGGLNDFEYLPETYLIQVVGPRVHGKSLYTNTDTKRINDGDYRVSLNEMKFAKLFIEDVFHPFYAWFRTSINGRKRDKMVPRRFGRGLFQRMLKKDSYEDIITIVEIFKNLGDAEPLRESDVNEQFWKMIDSILEQKKLETEIFKTTAEMV